MHIILESDGGRVEWWDGGCFASDRGSAKFYMRYDEIYGDWLRLRERFGGGVRIGRPTVGGRGYG